VVNSVEAAVASAVAGHDPTMAFSYQAAEQVREGRLAIVLAHAELPPRPVHLIIPEGRLAVPKVRLRRLRDSSTEGGVRPVECRR
jgi:DNA-binding transcriptional LysR family regulator